MSFTTYKTLTALGAMTALGLSAAFIGCSSDDNVTTPPLVDSGTDANTGPVQKGQVIEFSLSNTVTGVSGATVDLGGKTATTSDTAPKGSYSLAVTKDSPFYMRVTKAGYTTLLEQEWQVSGDADRARTVLPSATFTGALVTAIGKENVDGSKGVLGIGLVKGTCPTEAGATIQVNPTGTDASSTPVVYFSGGLPSQQQQTQAGELTPTALAFNVTLGAPTVVVTPPAGCKVLSFPYTDPSTPNITYTGNIKVEPVGSFADDAGAVTHLTSFARIFLAAQ